MDKWDELKCLVEADLSWDVHHSTERPYSKNTMVRVKRWMDLLESKENSRIEEVRRLSNIINHVHSTTLKKLEDKPKGFLFTDVPEFDKKTWEKMLSELQGLS